MSLQTQFLCQEPLAKFTSLENWRNLNLVLLKVVESVSRNPRISAIVINLQECRNNFVGDNREVMSNM